MTAATPGLTELEKMTARFAPAPVGADISHLSAGDRQAIPRLIEAAQIFNQIFLKQLWSGNEALYRELQKDETPLGKARLRYFWLNKGPWSDLDAHTAFLPGVPARKLPGSNFYPEDMTKPEFEAWSAKLPEPQRHAAEGFFTMIVRGPNHQLEAVPYSTYFRTELTRCAKLLHEAAALTTSASLTKFLKLRAEAFLSNDYYASDLAWMDVDAPIDITIGPYETYNDELFGYKAAFEAYVNIRDDAAAERVKFFTNHLQEVENALPIDARYKNPKLGSTTPMRIVDEIFASGDAAHGVQTAAYNLPNDERVVHEKGSKSVMLKNVQEAKFNATLLPISREVLSTAAQKQLSFDAFFTHIIAHELSHGIGPHQIEISGRATTPRKEIKELYSALEEAKADITGLLMLQHFYDRGYLANAERQLYTTYLASSFRTLRFGVEEAHGKGMAVQFNYLLDRGAILQHGATFDLDLPKMKAGIRDLAHDLLTIEATGDYNAARKLLSSQGVLRPNIAAAIQKLGAIPVDIAPQFQTQK